MVAGSSDRTCERSGEFATNSSYTFVVLVWPLVCLLDLPCLCVIWSHYFSSLHLSCLFSEMRGWDSVVLGASSSSGIQCPAPGFEQGGESSKKHRVLSLESVSVIHRCVIGRPKMCWLRTSVTQWIAWVPYSAAPGCQPGSLMRLPSARLAGRPVMVPPARLRPWWARPKGQCPPLTPHSPLPVGSLDWTVFPGRCLPRG